MKTSKGFHLPEWVKNLLIILLSLSALYLFSLSPLYLYSPVKGWTDRIFSGKDGPGPVSVSFTAAARPASIAVTNGAGRCGFQYAAADVDALFDQTGSLLGEALGSAGDFRPVSEQRWRQALGANGIYFDFVGSIPLSALAGWLQDGEQNPHLSGDVRRLVLAPGDDGQVWLYCQDAWSSASFTACATALSAQTHLEPAVAPFSPNGAKFAFELSDLEGCYPYTLITGGPDAVPVYTAASPLAAASTLDSVLSDLSFSGALVTSYQVDEGTVYRSGEDTLLLARDGTLTYHGSDGQRYPVSSGSAAPTLAEMIETTRQLLDSTVGSLCGDARLYLISARSGAETVITYGYSLNGAQVWSGREGWCAQFRLTGGSLTGFTLCPRSYTAADALTPLPPIRQATAAMEAKGAGGSELLLIYLDTGGDTATASWVAK